MEKSIGLYFYRERETVEKETKERLTLRQLEVIFYGDMVLALTIKMYDLPS